MNNNAISLEKQALNAVNCGKFSQTTLITGEQGSGKFKLALNLAKALLCTSSSDKPCNNCNSCHKIEQNIHPDLTILDLGESEIKVDTARALRKDIVVKPNDGDKRIVIIPNAHKMNIIAQNTLLKTLEEPPSYAFFILTTEKAGALLTTILSRCTKYALAPSSTQIEVDSYIDIVRPILRALANANELSLMQACMAIESLSRSSQKEVLQLIRIALRDALICANISGEIMLENLKNEINSIAINIASDKILDVCDLISQILLKLEVNASSATVSSMLCAGSYETCFI